MQNVFRSRPDQNRSALHSRFRTVKPSRRAVNRFILSAAFAAFIPQIATAASLVWNADNAVGDPVGGTGVWDTTATSWDNAGTMQAWNNVGNNTAIFGGIAGTVTLGTPITAGRLIFNTTGYTIAGGGNTLTLGGASSVTATAAGAPATILANVNLTGHSVFGGAGDLIFTNGAISGGFGITKTGAGSLTLGGTNSFSGPVAIRGGVVSINAPENLGDGSVTNTLTLATGGTLRTNGSFNLGTTRGPILQAGGGGFDVESGNLIVDGQISVNTGVGTNVENLTKSGAGTLTLTGNNAPAFHTYVDGGTLSFATAANLGTGNITINGGTLQSSATATLTNLLRLGTAGGIIDVATGTLTSSAAISGSGSLTKTGAGTLALGTASIFAGTTHVSQGTLQGAALLPARTAVTLDPGTILDYLNASGSIGSLSGSGTVQMSTTTTTTRIITLGNDGTNATFSGVFQAPTNVIRMAITKVGAGTQTLQLSAPTGYTGATTINAGTLNLDFSAGGLNTMLNSGTTPTLGGGNLQITGRSGSSTVSQGLGALTVAAGGGKIVMVPNGATATNLTTGAVTTAAAGGALLIQAPASTTVKLGTALDTAINGRIVFTDGLGNFNWATNAGSGTDTAALGTYSDVAGQTVSGTNTNNSRINSGVAYQTTTVGSGGLTTNTLLINPTAPNQSLSLGANNMTLTGGGLLYSGAHDYAITGTGALNSGLLVSGQADLIVHQHGTGNLMINSVIGTGTGTGTAQTFTKAGPGTVTLGTTTNTYGGGTFITGGTLSLSSNNLGSNAGSTVTIYDGATLQTTATMSLGTRILAHAGGNVTLDIAPSTSLTLGAAMTGTTAGNLILNNTGTLLGGVNTFINSTVTTLQLVGNATVNMNDFTLTVGGLSGGGTITNSSSTARALVFGGNNASTSFGGLISGAIGLTKNGTGVFTLNRAATYTGGTAITTGGVVFGVDNALPSASTNTLVLGNASGAGAFVDLNGFNWAAPAITFNGTSSAATSQSTIYVGNGVLTLGGTVTTTPNATAANGFVGARILGGRVDLGTTNRTIAVGDSINAGADLTITSIISSNGGNFGISKTGAGTLLLTGANTYLGTTTVNGAGGTLLLGGAGTLGSGTNSLTMTAGTLDLGGTSQSVGLLSGAGGTIQNSAAGTRSTLSIGNGSTATGTLSGAIIDGGGTIEVVKQGGGVISLNGANTYSGGTQVNEGALVFGTTVSKPATGVTEVAANAALGLGVGGAGTFSESDVDALFANTMPNVNLSVGASVALDTTAGNFTYSSNQSAARGLVKLGVNTLSLTGTNTYSGPTVLVAGNLEPSGVASLGAGPLVFNGGALRWPTATPFDVSTKTISLLGTSIFDTNGNNVTLANSFGEGGTGALTKVGLGTLTLAGGTNHTGNVVVTGGILQATSAINNGAGTTSVGSAAAARGIFWAGPGADYQTTTFSVGANATGAGSLVVTGGNVATTTASTSVGINLGDAGYGGVFVSGGSLSTHRFESNDAAGQTVMRVSGTGTLSSDEYIIFRNSRWEFTITGGQVLHNNATQNIALGYEGAGRTGVMTVAGGLVDNTGRNVSFGQNNTSTVSSLNLNAGMLITNAITLGTGGAVGNLNFNGGTLKAATDTTAFVPTLSSSYVNGPFGSFAGGAVIDSAGHNVTIATNMLAPVGNGVTTLNVDVAGSGYVGAPYVEITGGGGTGATGYAVVDLDPSSPTFGQVTGVVITNPGVNYTSPPTINLLGGGGTGASISGVVGANSSGGLTKNGAGTLTLSGTNTFTGATTVNGGTLSIAPTTIANTSSLVIGSTGSGALDLNQDNAGAAWNLPAGVNITLGGDPGVSGGLGFQLASNTSSSDRIVFGAGGTLTVNAGGGIINATSLSGFGVGSYDVISGATSITGDTNLRLGILPSGYQYGPLSVGGGTVTINVLGLTPAGDLYWTGGVNGSWSQVGPDTNWASNADGSGDGGNTPGVNNLVHFSATSAGASPINTTLDTAVSVPGVKFLNSGTGAVSIAPGISGTLNVGSAGLEVQTGAAAPVSISAPVILGANQTWTVADAASNLSVSGIISGTGNLIKDGAGTLTLSGANSFTSNVTLNSGTLRVATLGTTGLGTGAAALFLNGGELQIAETTARNLGRNTTVGGNVTISVDRLAAGAGVSHTLGTLSIGSHVVNVNAGSLATSGTMGLVFGATTLTGSPTFAVNNNGLGATTNLTLGAIDEGVSSRSITKTGDGTLTMPAAVAGANFSGGLIIKEGNVIGGGNANTFGANANVITLGDTTGSASTMLTGVSSFTYPQAINVAGGNTGVATIMAGTTSGAVVFSGLLTLNNHDVVLAKIGTSGTSQFIGGISGTGNVTINNTATTTGLLNLTGIVNPVGTITNLSTATGGSTISAAIGNNVTAINQDGATSQLILSGINSYIGPVTANAGILHFARQQALFGGNTPSWTASNLVVKPGAELGLNVGGPNEFTAADVTTLLGMSSATGGLMNGTTLRLDTATATGGNFIFDGPLANPNGGANALGLTKLGAGTLTLTGATTYTGPTTIMAGTLSGNIGNGNLVLNGGVFESSGSFTRSLGTGDGQVRWAAGGNGGFAAKGGPLMVTLAGAPSTLMWDSTANFVSGAGQLLFGSSTSDDVVTFTHNINLNDPGSAVTRTLQILDNAGVTTDKTVFSGVISGGSNATLAKTGPGILELTGANTYAGPTLVSQGTLIVSSIGGSGVTSSNLGAGNASLSLGSGSTTGGILTYTGAGETTNRPISLPATTTGGGTIISSGTGPLHWHGNVSSAGTTKTFVLSGDYTGSANTFSGAISIGTGNLSKTGLGTWALNAANTYANTTVNGGTLRLIGPGTIGTGTLTVTNGALDIVGNANQTATTLTMGNGGAGTASSINIGLGRSLTATAITYTVGTNSGASVIGGLGTLNLGSSGIVITIGDNTANAMDMAWQTGGLTGSGTLTKAGTGTLDIRGVATNSFGGSYLLNAGALAGPTSLTGNINLNGGVFESSGTFSRALGTGVGQVQWTATGTAGGGFAANGGALMIALSGAPNPLVWGSTPNFVTTGSPLIFGSTSANNVVTFTHGLNLNGAARTVQVIDNTTSTDDKAVLSGAITNGGLIKTGTGTLELTGTNSGLTDITINGGTLQFGTVDHLGGAATPLALQAGFLSFVGSSSLTLTNPLSGITGTASQTAGVRNLSANGTGGAIITFGSSITMGLNTLTLAGASEGRITGGISMTGNTTADLVNAAGTWTIRDTNINVSDDLIVNGGTLTLENMVATVNDDTVVTGGTLNLNSTGVLMAAVATGASSGLYARNGGVINLNASNINGVNNANGLDFIVLADTTPGLPATLNTNGFNITTPRLDVGQVADGLEAHVTGSGTITLTGTATDWSTGLRVLRGSVAANLAGVSSIWKAGAGTATLSGDNSGLTGTVAATRVDYGTLILDYTTNNNSKISTVAALDLRAGTLNLVGNATADTTQTVAGLTLNAGSAHLGLQHGGTQNLTLNLGGITRNANGTIDFGLSVNSSINTTAVNGFGNVLGGWATVNGQRFAAVSAGKIVAATTSAKDDVATWTAGDNVTDASGYFGTMGSASINSLVFESANSSTVTIGAPNTLAIASGGILVTANSGAGTITGGRLASDAHELIVHQNNLSDEFTIASSLDKDLSLTKAGQGTLVLSGNNNISSRPVYVGEGTLRGVGGNAIGDLSVITLPALNGLNPIVDLSNVTERIGGLSGGLGTAPGLGTVQLGATGTLIVDMSLSTSFVGVLSGGPDATFIKDGAGNFSVGAVRADFTGSVIVNNGGIRLDGNTSGQDVFSMARSFSINGQGSYVISDQDQDASMNLMANTATLSLANTSSTPALAAPNGLVVINTGEDDETLTETIGQTTLQAGHSSIFANTAAGATNTIIAVAALGGLTRQNHATLLVAGQNLGNVGAAAAHGRVTVSGATAASLGGIGGAVTAGTTSIAIVPYMVGTAAATATTEANLYLSTGNSLVTYDTAGFRPLDLTTEYEQLGAAGGITVANNVRFSSGTDLILNGTNKTMNSLVVDSPTAAIVLNGAGGSLNVQSGTFLFTGAQAATLSGFTGVTIGSGEYIFHVPSTAAAGVTVNAPLITPHAALVKSGPGILVLPSTASTYNGGTWFNQGLIEVPSISALGTGALHFSGGGLRWAAGSTFDPSASGRALNFEAGGAYFDTNGNNVSIANAIGNGGVGGFTKVGDGTLTIADTDVVNFSGGVTVAGGTAASSALVYGVSGALPASTNVTLGVNSALGGHLNIGNFPTTLAGLNINANSVISGSAALTFTDNVKAHGSASRTLTIDNLGLTTFNGDFITIVDRGGTGRTLTIAGSGNVVINSEVIDGADTGTLAYSGTGTLRLNTPNTHTGATSVTSGTLLVAHDRAIGLGGLTIGSGTLVAVEGDRVFDVTTFNVANGATSVISGDHSITINADNILLGNATSSTTTLTNNLAAGKTLTLNAEGVMRNNRGDANRTLTINGSGRTVINAVITDNPASTVRTTGLTYSGTGVLELYGANTYTGTTTVSGAVGVGHDQALGAGPLTLNAGTIFALGGDRVLSDVTTFSLSNGVTSMINGDHSITIDAENIWFGNSTSSTAVLTNNLAAGKTLTLNASGVMRNNRSDANRTLTINGTGHTVINATITDNPAATTRLTGLTFTGNGVLDLTGPNNYTGTTTINNNTATVNLTGAGKFGSGNLTVNAGTVNLNPAVDQTTAALSMGGGAAGSLATINIPSGRLLAPTAVTFSATNNNQAAVITGAGTLDLGSSGITVNIGNSTTTEVDMAWTMNTVIGSGQFTKDGAGTLDIRGVTNYNYAATAYQINAGAILGLNLLNNNIILNGGIYEDSGTLTRTLGTGNNQIQWLGAGGGGFAANGAPFTVTFAGAPDPLVWGVTPNFVPTGAPLVFGSATANDVVTFTHNIDLNDTGSAVTRTITVNDNTLSTNDRAVLSGNLTQSGTGSVTLTKAGAGTLLLTGNNTFSAVTITGGTLQYETISDNGVGPSSLGQGTDGITLAGTLSFVGATNQSTNRAITLTASSTLDASGAGTITYNGAVTANGSTVTLGGSGTGVLNGVITNTGSDADLNKTGTGSWQINVAQPTIPDNLVISAGTLIFGGANIFQGDDLFIRNATLKLVANGAITGSMDDLNVSTETASGAILDIAGTNGSTPTDIILGAAGFSGSIIDSVGGGSIGAVGTFNFRNGTVTASLTGAAALNKTTTGTVTLGGANTGYTGVTTVNTGTLILDYQTNNGEKLADAGAGALTGAGGNVILEGSDTLATLETLGGLTLSTGTTTISVNNGTGQTATLDLKAITRALSDGFVNFNLSSPSASILTSTANLSNSILAGWATVGGTNFATVNGGSIVAATSVIRDDLATWALGEDVTDSAGYFGTTGTTRINSLIFSANAAPSTVAIAPDATLTIGSGGILITPNVGTAIASISGGRLASGTSGELMVHQHNTQQSFTISSSLVGTTRLTKGGEGVLILSGDNTNSGTITILSGELRVSGGRAISDFSPVAIENVAGAVLNLNNGVETIGNLSGAGTIGGSVSVGTGALTIRQSAVSTYTGSFSGSGTVTKTGAATWTWDTDSQTSPGFTGTFQVNQGQVTMSGAVGALPEVTSIVLNGPGSVLQLNNDQTTAVGSRLNDDVVVTLNNTAGGLGLSVSRNAGATTGTETMGQLVLGAGHNTIAADGTAVDRIGVARFTGATPLVRQNFSTALLLGRNLGVSAGQRGSIVFATDPGGAVGGPGAAGSTTLSIYPYFVGEVTTAAPNAATNVGNSFVTMVDGTVGMRPLNLTTEYVLGQTNYDSLGAGVLTNNVRFIEGTATLDADTTGINSLVLDSAAGINVIGPAQSFEITSGALLSAGTGANTIAGFTGITTAASRPYYAYVTNAAGSLVMSSPLTSGVPLVKSGAGTIVLENTNNGFTDVYFNQGAVQADALNKLGSGTFRFFGGTLKFGAAFDPSAKTMTFDRGGGTFDTNGFNISLANSIGNGGAGTFTKTGTGTLTLNAPVNYTGTTIVSNGTLTYGVANALPATMDLTLGVATLNHGAFDATLRDFMLIASGTISGAGNLIFTGPVEVDGGAARTLAINNASTSFNGDRFTLVNTGTTARTLTITGTGDVTISGQINDGSAAGSLAITSSGVTTLGGANTYSGATTMNNAAGTLVLAGSNSSTAATVLTAGGIRFASAYNGGLASGLLTLTSGTIEAIGAPRTISNNVTLTAVTVQGSEDLTFNGTLTATGASNRTLINNIGAGRTLSLNNVNISDNASSRTLILSGTGNTTIRGVIANGTATTGALQITNSGVTILEGNNSYTGVTTIDAGLVRIRHNNALGTTANGTIVTGGASLELDGDINVPAEALTISGTGTVAATGALRNLSGTNNYAGLVTLAGPATIHSAGGTLNLTHTGTITGPGFTLTLTGAGNGSIASAIGTTSGGVIKTGAGAWTLSSGNSTFTGGVNVSEGTLVIGANSTPLSGAVTSGPLGTGTLTVGNATLQGTSGGAWTIGNQVVINGDVTFGGSTANESLTLTGATDLGSTTRTLTVSSAAVTTTVSGAMSGSAGLTKAGAGTLELRGANSYGGDTTVSAGTLRLGANDVLPDGAGKGNVSVSGMLDLAGRSDTINGLSGTGTIDNTTNASSSTLTIGATDATSAFGGTIQNTGTSASLALVKTGSGTLELSGTNTYRGGTTINGGTLAVSADANLGDTTGALTFGGVSTLSVTDDLSTSRAVNLNAAATVAVAASKTAIVSGQISGSAGLTKDGAGTLVLANANTAALNRNNYSGGTTINAGTVEVTLNEQLGSDAGSVTFAGASTLRAAGDLTSNRSFTLNAAGTFEVTSGKTMTLGATSELHGGQGMIKSGAGTLVVNSNNSTRFTGPTTIEGGTYVAANTSGSATGDGAVFVSAAGTLAGNGSISGSVTLDGTLAPGLSIGTLSMGALSFEDGSTFELELEVATLTSDRVNITGNLSLDGTVTLALDEIGAPTMLNIGDRITLATYTGTWDGGLFTVPGFGPIGDWTNNETAQYFELNGNLLSLDYNFDADLGSSSNPLGVTLIVVPEPGSFASLAGAAGLLLGLQRFRRRRA